VLRSLSKLINEKNPTLDSYCIGNSTRPLLSVGAKGTKGRSRKTYLYVEALRRYEEELGRLDLTEAYKKALPVYKGRLEHSFVVLKDDVGDVPQATGGNNEPIGQKRKPTDTEGGNSKKKAN